MQVQYQHNPIIILPKMSKMQIALALSLAVNSMINDEQRRRNAEWNCRHNTKDDLLREVKKHNLSRDKEGNMTSPYRFNDVVNAYTNRVAEYFNLSDRSKVTLNSIIGKEFYVEYGGMLEEYEIPAAMQKIKRELRKYLPGIISELGPSSSYLERGNNIGRNSFYSDIKARDEDFHEATDLLNAIECSGVSGIDCSEEMDALLGKLRSGIKAMQETSKQAMAAFSRGEIVYIAWRAGKGISAKDEMSRSERNLLQRAVADGILIRDEHDRYKGAIHEGK